MKILNLTFANLNSLQGVWHIDFTSPEFRDGLFLIAGDTGAGKTTILDAISLALYGRTVRVKVAQSSNETMTRGTGHSMAEVTFACGAGRFRATWEQRRARNKPDGALQAATMRLFDCQTDTHRQGTLVDIQRQIVETVGLTFEQFQRTMMLAQGKFDQFLTANKNDRAEILQQATGTEIYEKIGKSIYERFKEAEEQKKSKELELGLLVPLDADALAEKLREHAQTKKQAKEAGMAARAKQSETERVQNLQEAFCKAKAAERRREDDLRDAEEACRRATLAAQTAKKAATDAETAQKEQTPSLKKAVELGNARKIAKAAFAEKQTALGTAKSELDAVLAKLKAETNAAASHAYVRDILADALDNQRFAEKNKANIPKSKDIKQAYAFVQMTGELASAAAKEEELHKKASAAQRALDKEETQCAVKRPLLTANLENARNARDLALRVASLEAHREALEDGKPCPLCGALDHPYAVGGLPSQDDCTRALNAAQKALDALNAELDAKRAARDAARKVLEAFVRENEDLRQRHDELKTLLIARRAKYDTAQQKAAEQAKALRKEQTMRETVAKKCDAAQKTAQAELDKLNAAYAALNISGDPETLLAGLQRAADAARKRLADANANAKAADTALCSAKREAKAAKADLQEAEKAVQGLPDLNRLTQEASALRKQHQELQERLGALRHELETDKETRKSYDACKKKRDDAVAAFEDWKALNAYFGGLNGDHFKRYAQRITLGILLRHAKPHLDRMTGGRYELVEDAKSEELLPLVCDREQGGTLRPVSNLSGGERFQVSLALALGLSAMSANRLRVDSLFLDEGFGTLDSQTLEAALDTLCALQQDGKTIGVISHVAEVAERLTTQIRVRKRGNGHSELSGAGVSKKDEPEA